MSNIKKKKTIFYKRMNFTYQFQIEEICHDFTAEYVTNCFILFLVDAKIVLKCDHYKFKRDSLNFSLRVCRLLKKFHVNRIALALLQRYSYYLRS